MRFNKEEVGQCYDFLNHHDQTEIRLICPRKHQPPKSVFVETKEEFIKACEKYNEEYNIYAGINERCLNGTEGKEVLSVKTIVLDIDAVREKGFEKEPATEEELLECEKDTDEIIASMVSAGANTPTKIYSGNGYQIWIAIPEIELDEKNRKKIETKLQLFQDVIKKRYENHGGIDKIGDLPRIIKVWGTWNIKGNDNGTRKHRLCRVEIGGTRNPDEKLWEQVEALKEEDYESIDIVKTDELEKEFLPYPIKFIMYKYEHKTPDNWMRIIETIATFLRGVGLETEKAISYLIEWSRRQPYREIGEEREIISIVTRIYKNKINCPNFDKLVNKEVGYPFFGLKEVFNGVSLGDDWIKYKNPVKYYKVKRERSSMTTIDKLRSDVKSWLLAKNQEEASELVVKYILEKNYIYTTRDDVKSEMWIYKNGIYTPNGKTYIKELCRKILEENFTVKFVNEVLNKIEPDTYIDQDKFFNCESSDEIAVENGILNIFTRELTTFSPEKIFFNKIPIFYNPDETCENIDMFFKDILKEKEDSKVMYELIGYSLMKDYRFEKAFMFVGNGRNGKGKTLLLMKKFLGGENCVGIPLSQLIPSSTSVCELHGRLLNLAGDLSNTDLKNTGMFKQLTGRDLITAKRKYLKDLFFTNYAKLVFACNDLPRVYDLSVGFWSRWVVLEFPYTFVKKEAYELLDDDEKKVHKIMDEDIITKISKPEEMSGLLNKALDGLDRLLKNKDFAYTKGTKDVKDMWIRKSDSFTAFCYDCVTEDYSASVTKKDLRKRFHKYCKEHKIKGAGDRAMKVVLEDNFGVIEGRKEIMGKYEYVWEGIKFKMEKC